MTTDSTSIDKPAETVDLADVQGNILRGYRKAVVRHIVVQVNDPLRARTWIAAAAGPDRSLAPSITTAEDWGDKPPEVCFNLGITCPGLRALGVPESTTASFPEAFREGMVARASKLGDWDLSGPEHWQPWFQSSDALHLILTLHGDDNQQIDKFEAAMFAGAASQAFKVCGHNDGAVFNRNEVHFGYQDNISQPRFANISPRGATDDQPFAPLGTVLLGYPTALEQVQWTLPSPEVLGRNGTFNAYRVLEQDVAGFEHYLDQAAESLIDNPLASELLPTDKSASREDRFASLREVVAAKFCGRWRNGTPLALSPRDSTPLPPESNNLFHYMDDSQGLKCPIGSHIRRTNPRGDKIVQRMANHTRRLVRRGIPYGPRFDPAHPDDQERGLLGVFLCADLAAQFEAIQYDWINLGLQNPEITGSNDPLLGANQPDASWFDINTKSGSVRLRGFPRFVRTRGGAYTFLPSLSAMRWIGSLAR
ncbi:MAG: Dyp-type peroxidase [Cyanobacteriota bacterium]